MVDDFDDMEKAFGDSVKSESDILNEQIDKLKRENINLKRTLWEYSIDVESSVSDEEYICIIQLERLRELSERADLSEQEVRIFDILNKNLRMIRGGVEKKTPKGKPISKGDLLKIVDGGKNPNE